MWQRFVWKAIVGDACCLHLKLRSGPSSDLCEFVQVVISTFRKFAHSMLQRKQKANICFKQSIAAHVHLSVYFSFRSSRVAWNDVFFPCFRQTFHATLQMNTYSRPTRHAVAARHLARASERQSVAVNMKCAEPLPCGFVEAKMRVVVSILAYYARAQSASRSETLTLPRMKIALL